MERTWSTILLLVLAAVPALSRFNINDLGMTGVALDKMTCNVQTTLEFKFNSSTFTNGATNITAASLVLAGSHRPIPVSAISPSSTTRATTSS